MAEKPTHLTPMYIKRKIIMNRHAYKIISGCLLFFFQCIPAFSGQVSSQFDFTVNVAAGTCEASVPDSVDMGTIYNTDLMPEGKHGPKTSFDINLTNCVWVSTVQVEMDGAAPDNFPQYFAVTGDSSESSAGDIALEITDDNNKVMQPGQGGDPWPVPSGSDSSVLHFYADYVSIGDKVSGGDADATVTVNFSYE